ncbi:glycoside hydrolase family 128 protein [Daedalea quercina L-15889]|uniref:Glycoside hydrolase family 128 protein n=1 Tax=Daedalea quercina L-15889 TaxID=1314783 RepID=A0A165SWK4_9APHY|nr:glycoside hydrolase family 128 protein [Daedalea quercina L-15889]
MISIKLLNLLTVGGVALFLSSLAPSVNGLSNVGSKHQQLNRLVAHGGISKRAAQQKRSLSKRCKTRDNSTSSDVASSTSWSSSYVAPTSSYAATTEWSSSSYYTPTDTPTTTWTSTSSTSSTAASPTSSSGSGSGKVGVAWTGSNDQELATVKTSSTKFLYNWSAWKPSNSDSLGYEFWPMFHDASSVSDFESNVVAGYGTNILGFNEPEQSGQANMDAGTAASLWQQYIEPKKDIGYGLISPAVTSDQAGIPWMQSFISECNGGCTFTAGCALHYYGTDPNDFISYVQTYYSTLQSSCSVLHVTEFACMDFSGATTPDESQIWDFYSTAIKWMDSQDYIASYFAFGILDDMGNVITQDALLSDGTPTSLGYTYIYDSWT